MGQKGFSAVGSLFSDKLLGHVQLKNVDVDTNGPLGRVEGESDGLKLDFDSACDGWAK